MDRILIMNYLRLLITKGYTSEDGDLRYGEDPMSKTSFETFKG